jgi:hypothetical protein
MAYPIYAVHQYQSLAKQLQQDWVLVILYKVSRFARENLSRNLVIEDADPRLRPRPVQKSLSCISFTYAKSVYQLSKQLLKSTTIDHNCIESKRIIGQLKKSIARQPINGRNNRMLSKNKAGDSYHTDLST